MCTVQSDKHLGVACRRRWCWWNDNENIDNHNADGDTDGQRRASLARADARPRGSQ